MVTKMEIECPSCLESKPIEAFGKASWRKSGISYRCRKCSSQSTLHWARNNPDKVRSASQRAYKKWREKHPLVERPPLLNSDGRLCRTCNNRKPDSAFGKDPRSKNGRAWRCKECAKAAHLKWRDANREHVRDVARGSSRKSRANAPAKAREAARNIRIKKKYGLTPTDLDAMIASQDGACGICRRSIRFTGDRVDEAAAHIDHNHDTGRVRGLLCSTCNTALGKFKDSVAVLSSAIEYLRRHSE